MPDSPNLPVEPALSFPAPAPEPQPAPAPAARRLRALLLWGVVPLLLFAGSALVSWLTGRTSAPPLAEADHHRPRAAAPDAEAPAPAETPAERLQRADQWLREHRFAAALPLYKELLLAEPAGPLHYRTGLCQEGLGNADKALASYQLAASDAAAPAVHVPAQLAQAKVLLRQQHPEQAAGLLYPIVLGEAPHRPAPAAYADARYLLALALAQQAQPPAPAGSLLAQFALPPAAPLPLPTDLVELQPQAAPQRQPNAADNEELRSQRPTDGGEARVVHARLLTQGAANVFELLAKNGGLTLQATPAAQRTLQERGLRLVLKDWSLTELILAAADALSLSCRMDGVVLQLATAHEAEAGQHQAFRQELARRNLQSALQQQAQHRLVPAAYLHLARLELAAGYPLPALDACEKLLREAPTSPLTLQANHNLGLLYATQGDAVAARKAFFRQIDLAPGHELAPVAYLRIGLLYLEAGDTKLAAASFKQAQASAAATDSASSAAGWLAATHLIAADPDRAATWLRQHRQLLLREPFRTQAALLEGLAALRLARAAGPARWQVSQLVSILARLRDEPVRDPVWVQLLGEACAETGLWSEAVALYERAIPTVRGPKLGALRLAHAAALVQVGKSDDARAILNALAGRGESPWAERAALRLAELDLEHDKAIDAVRRCAQLHARPGTLEPAAILRLWGAGLASLGEYDKAARCLAGQPPE